MKVLSSVKAMIKLIKTVRINFFRTPENVYSSKTVEFTENSELCGI